jgi:NAD(P)-dependent dehydrogenase (short-subunit alcohol dehydrogenase family)
MSDRLQGRTAIITGAARGIGYATANLFLQEGARVGLVDFDASSLTDTACKLARDRSDGRVFARSADIANAAGIAAAIDGLAKDLGGVDILTNNAAARAYGTIADATPESWDTILQTNITGLPTAAALRCRICASGETQASSSCLPPSRLRAGPIWVNTTRPRRLFSP